MKTNLLIGVLGILWLVLPAKAQLQKGTKYVAATISSTGNGQHHKDRKNNYSEKVNQISVNPSFQVGKFINDNKMIGVGAGANLNFIKQKYISPYGTDTHKNNYATYTLSPYIRHYKPLNTKWAIFLNSSVNLSYLHSNSDIWDYDYWMRSVKRDGYAGGITVNPGISYWISPRFALESDINVLSLGVTYQDFNNVKNFTFRSVATSNLTSYFSVRASWYLQKP
jgi:hypothetical protein